MQSTRKCSVEKCERAAVARGMCNMHYERLRRRGTTADPAKNVCAVPNCARKHYGKGLCAMHRARFTRTGSTDLAPRVTQDVSERFWAKVDKHSDRGCWVWNAPLDSEGYGSFVITEHGKSKTIRAHRFAYQAAIGDIAPGMHTDHLCRNRACCNPAHLEVVTHKENLRRGMSPSAIAVRTNICQRGHRFSSENTYVTPKGKRQCRECMRERARRYRNRSMTE